MNVTPLDLRNQQFRSSMRGFDKDEVLAFLAEAADDYAAALDTVLPLFEAAARCRAARVTGLMVLPPFAEDPEDARPYFRRLLEIQGELGGRGVPPAMLRELSMGMSHDFEVAIEEGATLVRVGTAIFGQRAPRP